jgi:RNA polymerase sigma-70 factor (ECF subfamily)
MRPDDRQPAFPSTQWSRILAPGGARDLDALARAYWRPIRAWLGARLRCRDADADDLAQEAFAWILQTDLFDKADPARGRFRAFLKRSLHNFAIDRVRRSRAHKRGGTTTTTSLDDAEPGDPQARTPDEILDEAWRKELLQQAQQRLERELEGGPRELHYRLFRDYFLASGDEPDHAALAGRYGITRADVSNWLDSAKRRYRAILRELVRETVGNGDDLQEELRLLFGEAWSKKP